MTQQMTQAATTPTIDGSAVANTPAAPQATGQAQANQQAATEAKQDTLAQVQQQQNAFSLKAPEGYDLDAEVLTQYTKTAKDLGLAPENAQKLIDQLTPMIQDRTYARMAETRNQWQELAKNDKEFGGEKLDANLSVARKALDTFGTPELRQLLNETGLGNNPELIRAFYRAGLAISEDRYVGGNKATAKSGPRDFNSLASALYPNG
jgi:hypothetical protein